LDSVTCKGKLVLQVYTEEELNKGKMTVSIFYWIIILVSIVLLTVMNFKKPFRKSML